MNESASKARDDRIANLLRQLHGILEELDALECAHPAILVDQAIYMLGGTTDLVGEEYGSLADPVAARPGGRRRVRDVRTAD